MSAEMDALDAASQNLAAMVETMDVTVPEFAAIVAQWPGLIESLEHYRATRAALYGSYFGGAVSGRHEV